MVRFSASRVGRINKPSGEAKKPRLSKAEKATISLANENLQSSISIDADEENNMSTEDSFTTVQIVSPTSYAEIVE
jgi:hypothetical protein